MQIDLLPLIERIASQYTLDPHDTHGLGHWARVLENGLKLAESEGGDIKVISLFAIFHDACRHNQSLDPGHGARGAELAETLLYDHPQVSRQQLELLKEACRGHTDGETDADLTVQICWDSDRLDLARVPIMPAAHRLCTQTAKSNEIIKWANERASSGYIPDFVTQEWDRFFNTENDT
jgi:uncharacterized protein